MQGRYRVNSGHPKRIDFTNIKFKRNLFNMTVVTMSGFLTSTKVIKICTNLNHRVFVSREARHGNNCHCAQILMLKRLTII